MQFEHKYNCLWLKLETSDWISCIKQLMKTWFMIFPHILNTCLCCMIMEIKSNRNEFLSIWMHLKNDRYQSIIHFSLFLKFEFYCLIKCNVTSIAVWMLLFHGHLWRMIVLVLLYIFFFWFWIVNLYLFFFLYSITWTKIIVYLHWQSIWNRFGFCILCVSGN